MQPKSKLRRTLRAKLRLGHFSPRTESAYVDAGSSAGGTFLYRHVIDRPLMGLGTAVPRARDPTRLPIVLGDRMRCEGSTPPPLRAMTVGDARAAAKTLRHSFATYLLEAGTFT
ncbi:MAG: hypothetical protein ABR543_04810 [Gemmatimonadaceae bacterium]